MRQDLKVLYWRITDNFDALYKRYNKGFKEAQAKAITATINEVFKYTLPNSPTTGDSNYNKKSASKVKSQMKRNLEALRKRIKKDILCFSEKGGENKKSIPSAFSANEKGIIARNTKKGKIKQGYVILRKDKSKKKKQIIPFNYTSDRDTLIKHIEKSTNLYKKKGKVAFRLKRKGSKIIWIDSAKTAEAAAEKMSRDAGALLSGWRALQSKILMIKGQELGVSNDILSDILQKTNQNKPKGTGSITQTEDKINVKAENPNVEKPVQNYQNKVVNDNIGKNLKKHLEREITFYLDSVKKEMKKNNKRK